jgi:hypothetical protein
MRRAALTLFTMLVLAAGVAAADLSGKWTFEGDIQGNAVTLSCTVQQNAQAKLSGPCDINGQAQADLEGSVTDAAIQFSVTVQGYTLTYTGKVEGDSASGTIEVAGAGGTFAGTRAK